MGVPVNSQYLAITFFDVVEQCDEPRDRCRIELRQLRGELVTLHPDLFGISFPSCKESAIFGRTL